MDHVETLEEAQRRARDNAHELIAAHEEIQRLQSQIQRLTDPSTVIFRCPPCDGKGVRGTITCRDCGGVGVMNQLAAERHAQYLAQLEQTLGQIAAPGCSVRYADKPDEWTCLDHQHEAAYGPGRYGEPYRTELIRGLHLCIHCRAKQALVKPWSNQGSDRAQAHLVRTDRLEALIAHYDAVGDFAGANVLRRLANEVGASLNHDAIGRDTAMRRAKYWGDDSSVPSEEAIAAAVDYAHQQSKQTSKFV